MASRLFEDENFLAAIFIVIPSAATTEFSPHVNVSYVYKTSAENKFRHIIYCKHNY